MLPVFILCHMIYLEGFFVFDILNKIYIGINPQTFSRRRIKITLYNIHKINLFVLSGNCFQRKSHVCPLYFSGPG